MSYDAIGDGQVLAVPASGPGAAATAFASPTTTRAGVLVCNAGAGDVIVRLRPASSPAPTAAEVLAVPSYRIPAGSSVPIGVRGNTLLYFAGTSAGSVTVQELI